MKTVKPFLGSLYLVLAAGWFVKTATDGTGAGHRDETEELQGELHNVRGRVKSKWGIPIKIGDLVTDNAGVIHKVLMTYSHHVLCTDHRFYDPKMLTIFKRIEEDRR